MGADTRRALALAQALQGAAAAMAPQPAERPASRGAAPTGGDLLDAYDSLVTDAEIHKCTCRLFKDGHYGKAVEEAYICLDRLVQERTRRADTGAPLMRAVLWNSGQPLLRLEGLSPSSDRSRQEGFAHTAAGRMMYCRNPRAHTHGVEDAPGDALKMIAWADHLTTQVRGAKRTRKRKPKDP